MTKKEEDSISTLIAWAFVPVCSGFVFMWYNRLFLPTQFHYWQWMIVGSGVIFAARLFKPLQWVLATLLAVAVITQCLSWAGMITIPIFK